MPYVTTNPPVLMVPRLGAGGSGIWTYVSDDVHTDVDAADYFSNGDDLGMVVNDTVIVVDTTAGTTIHRVSAVTAGGAATVAAATLA